MRERAELLRKLERETASGTDARDGRFGSSADELEEQAETLMQFILSHAAREAEFEEDLDL
jgi:hypothetical protein